MRPTSAAVVAEVRIYNPDGSEAELSGNGVREAVMYLRRTGWTEHDSFSVRTAAGEIRPRIDGDAVHDRHGARATARAGGLPRRRRGRHGHARPRRAASSRFQFVQVGNPQCAIEIDEGLEELDLARYGPPIERHELFPEPHQRVVLARAPATTAIRARIFERGVGETMSSGTGATGAAVAAVLRGVDSPVTVDARRRRARRSRWARTCTWT